MPVKIYKPEHHEWLASFIPGHTCVEVSEEFNKRFELQITPEKVHNYKTNHKIKSGTLKGKPKWSGPLWTKEMADFVIANNKGYDFGYSEDAAPRQLTGDCKIRVRKA